MKGIHIQFENIISFIDSALPKEQTQQYECYLLNLQKITLETFSIMNIILINSPDEVPLEVRSTFEKTIKKFKQYFKNRPGIFNQRQEYRLQQFDEVKYFLEHRIDVTNNDDKERGQLYKFLNQSEEKEKSNQILLNNIPKYTYYGNSANNTKILTRDTKNLFSAINQPLQIKILCEEKQIQTYAQDFIDQGGIRKNTRYRTILSKENLSNQTFQTNQIETQTDINIQALKQLIEKYSQQMMKDKNEHETTNAIEQVLICLKNSTDKVLKIKKNQGKGNRKKNNKNKQEIDKEMNLTSISNLDKLQGQMSQKQKNIKENSSKIKHNNSITAKISQKSLKTSKNAVTIRTINQSSEKEEIASKNKINHRSSISKNVKNYKFQNHRGNKHSPFFNNDPQKDVQPEQNRTLNINKNQIKNKKEKNASHIQNIEESLLKKKHFLQRQNVDQQKVNLYSNFEQKPRSQKIEENNLDRQARDTDDCRLSVPLLMQEGKNQNWQNQNLPFGHIDSNKANELNRNEEKKLSNVKFLPTLEKQIDLRKSSAQKLLTSIITKQNSCSVEQLSNFGQKNLNHQSLYMRHSQNFNSNRFAHLWQNHKQKNSQSTYQKFPQLSNQQQFFEKNKYDNMSSEQKKIFLERENHRIINEIKDSTTQKKNKSIQWLKLVRSIRQYQTLHTRICGENCIHLKKFNDFLKKHNLSMYSNRKLLQMHKKNIEINGAYQS